LALFYFFEEIFFTEEFADAWWMEILSILSAISPWGYSRGREECKERLHYQGAHFQNRASNQFSKSMLCGKYCLYEFLSWELLSLRGYKTSTKSTAEDPSLLRNWGYTLGEVDFHPVTSFNLI
jgi:hypothetical protein